MTRTAAAIDTDLQSTWLQLGKLETDYLGMKAGLCERITALRTEQTAVAAEAAKLAPEALAKRIEALEAQKETETE